MFKALGRAFVDNLIDKAEISQLRLKKKKNKPISRLENKTHALFEIKMAKIATLFLTKPAKESYPLGSHIPIWPI